VPPRAAFSKVDLEAETLEANEIENLDGSRRRT